VSVENGAVTLAGHGSGYPQKVAAVRAAERVFGVRAVAAELVVEPPEARRKPTASELREQVTQALKNQLIVEL
jgi:hypothetical protein